jgi:hypothetical protein
LCPDGQLSAWKDAAVPIERVLVTTGLAQMEGEIAMYIRASDNSPGFS